MNEDEQSLLHLYLGDHLAGARGGSELAKRTAEAEKERPMGQAMQRIARDLEEDLEQLRTACEALGAPPHAAFKEGLSWLGEKLARAKLNGRLVSRSPMSLVLELELLQGAVFSKRALWHTLSEVPETRRTLEGVVPLERLVERANEQFSLLRELHSNAIQEAFSGEG